jgi:hypothetical protein
MTDRRRPLKFGKNRALKILPFQIKWIFERRGRRKTGGTENRNDLDHGAGKKNLCGG